MQLEPHFEEEYDNFMQMEFGERNMWAAVVNSALEDATLIISKIKDNLEMYGCTCERNDWILRKIYQEIQSDWFYKICLHIDLHPDHLYRKIQKMENASSIQARVIISDDEWENRDKKPLKKRYRWRKV